MLAQLWALWHKPLFIESMFSKRAYWEEDIQFSPVEDNLSLQDDAQHVSQVPEYFEWWYFDISLPDDGALAIIFHLTDLINPFEKSGSINVAYFRPGKPKLNIFKRYAPENIIASKERCDVRIGANSCKVDDDGNYTLVIKEEEIRVNLSFKTLVSGWKPGDGLIKFGNATRFFGWAVPQPRADVFGTIDIDGLSETLKGIGYHDHNWGTVSLMETLNAWSWGRIYTDDFTLVFADMHFAPKYHSLRPMIFMLAYQNKKIISGFLDNSEALDDRSDFIYKSDQEIRPEGMTFSWSGNLGSFEFILRTKQVLEQADLLRDRSYFIRKGIEKMVAQPRYIRFNTHVQAKLHLKDINRVITGGKAICEQMVLRKPQLVKTN